LKTICLLNAGNVHGWPLRKPMKIDRVPYLAALFTHHLQCIFKTVGSSMFMRVRLRVLFQLFSIKHFQSHTLFPLSDNRTCEPGPEDWGVWVRNLGHGKQQTFSASWEPGERLTTLLVSWCSHHSARAFMPVSCRVL
jgi:hypothetical protein